MTLEVVQRIGRDPLHRAPQFDADLAHEPLGEMSDVLGPIPQRGKRIVYWASRKYRSERNCPSFTRACRSLLVAAMNRTSMDFGWLAPTVWSCRDSSTRSSLAWRPRGRLPILVEE